MSTQPKDDIDELVGALILARQRRKWTLKHIADRCGVRRDEIYRLESGFIDPPARLLRAYARAVGLELTWGLK